MSHKTEAEAALASTEGLVSLGLMDTPELAQAAVGAAQAHALLAVADQLRLANLIALTDYGWRGVDVEDVARAALTERFTNEDSQRDHRLRPEIADLLGVKP